MADKLTFIYIHELSTLLEGILLCSTAAPIHGWCCQAEASPDPTGPAQPCKHTSKHELLC